MKSLMLFLLLSASCFAQQQRMMLDRPKHTSGGGSYTPATDANVFAWYKADAIVGTNATAIASWPDSSSSGYNLSAIGSAKWYNSVQNSLPAVLFSSTANSQAKSSSFTGKTSPQTIFFVYKMVDTSSTYGFMMSNDSTGWLMRANTQVQCNVGGSYVSAWNLDNVWHIGMIVFNNSSSLYRLDGGAETAMSGTLGANSIALICLGYNDNYGLGWGGYFGEILFYAGDQSVASGNGHATEIFNYLDTRWAVY